jgi:hypothetical protein
MSSENKFPSETIDLPSGGKFYPETSPLHSGQIELRYMTTREEDILTSTNLISKGVVLDRLFESLIATPGVKPTDLLVGDLNAVMIASRILGYGKDYEVTTSCPVCDTTQKVTVDLTQLVNKEPLTTVTLVGSTFKVELPVSKATVVFKLLTRGDEKKMQSEIEGYKKIDKDVQPETSTFFKFIIVSINDQTESSMIAQFVNSMLVRDSRFLRETYRQCMPDIKLEFNYTCTGCDKNSEVKLPISVNFFWPDAGV